MGPLRRILWDSQDPDSFYKRFRLYPTSTLIKRQTAAASWRRQGEIDTWEECYLQLLRRDPCYNHVTVTKPAKESSSVFQLVLCGKWAVPNSATSSPSVFLVGPTWNAESLRSMVFLPSAVKSRNPSYFTCHLLFILLLIIYNIVFKGRSGEDGNKSRSSIGGV